MNDMDNQDYDMLFKILVIGDSGVGKSNLLLRYTKNEYSENLKSTVGADFYSKILTIDQIVVKTQIWDTAGQERFRAITTTYYQGSKGVLIMFDLTKAESFDSVNRWVNEYKMNSDANSIMVLVGNKSDLIEQRVITKETAEAKAKQLSLAYFETSAKDNINVDLAFNSLIESITHKYQVMLTDEKMDSFLSDGLRINTDSQCYSIDNGNGNNTYRNNNSNSTNDNNNNKKKSNSKNINCCK